MESMLINHPRLRVHKRTGSEGPRHDPYAFEELHVTTDQHDLVLHSGLGSWLKVDGRTLDCPSGVDWKTWEKALFKIFCTLVGYTPIQLERIHNRLTARCRKCGGTDFGWARGFPGETFTVCNSCNSIVDSTFDISAVE